MLDPNAMRIVKQKGGKKLKEKSNMKPHQQKKKPIKKAKPTNQKNPQKTKKPNKKQKNPTKNNKNPKKPQTLVTFVLVQRIASSACNIEKNPWNLHSLRKIHLRK